MKRITGTYQIILENKHFTPHPLPPSSPPLAIDGELIELYGQAMHHLGKLNEMANRLPDIQRFIKAYVIKEALLSSEIEGIHTTLVSVFTQPLLASKPDKATQLVLNYTQALDTALVLIQKQGLPITTRVLLAAHRTLMKSGEGEKSDPGNFRKLSVRVGNLVPPAAPEIPQLMYDLEQFINEDSSAPPLIKAGLAHLQFETIHPFLDGNGRIGRLLIILMMIENGLLKEPILYISYFFKKNHMSYYHHLDRVRTEGDFEGWIKFFLQAIVESSQDAYQRAQAIEQLEQKLTDQINSNEIFKTIKASALQAVNALFSSPVISVSELATKIEKSYNSADNLIEKFVSIGLLKEEGNQKRNRLFRFQDYLDILEQTY